MPQTYCASGIGNALEVLLHEVGHLPEHYAALRGGEARPRSLERRARSAHRRVDIGGTAGGDP
jgi:hypothetical protein